MQVASVQGAVGRVAVQLVQLPAEDISLVAEFVTYLKRQRRSAPRLHLSPAEMVAAARRQADLLSQIPRAAVVARFDALVEEIRQQAIDRGTAIEGDWIGD